MEIIGYAPVLIKEEGDFKLYRKKPFYDELVCSEGSYFRHKLTNKNMGLRVYLFIHTFDAEGRDLPESEWKHEVKEDYEWRVEV